MNWLPFRRFLFCNFRSRVCGWGFFFDNHKRVQKNTVFTKNGEKKGKKNSLPSVHHQPLQETNLFPQGGDVADV